MWQEKADFKLRHVCGKAGFPIKNSWLATAVMIMIHLNSAGPWFNPAVCLYSRLYPFVI
jgi:hypothetical protein